MLLTTNKDYCIIKLKVRRVKMLRIKQVMEQYHVCRATIYNWFKQGLPFIKVGKITFIEEKEVEKFIKKGS